MRLWATRVSPEKVTRYGAATNVGRARRVWNLAARTGVRPCGASQQMPPRGAVRPRGSPMQPHVDVEASVQLRLVVADADAVPLPVSLRYSAADPYAVRAVFSGDGMEVEWVFARDLLRTGLSTPIGDGDVHVWPSWGTGRELVMISLTSPDGQAVLEAGADDVRTFLDRTAAVVPDGEESLYLDLDAAVARLLA